MYDFNAWAKGLRLSYQTYLLIANCYKNIGGTKELVVLLWLSGDQI